MPVNGIGPLGSMRNVRSLFEPIEIAADRLVLGRVRDLRTGVVEQVRAGNPHAYTLEQLTGFWRQGRLSVDSRGRVLQVQGEQRMGYMRGIGPQHAR